ncbi:hypothetical protein J2D78_01495 [Microbacterium maritypicum]|uniref:hypothetical protein n=1 Tax=Microbacterium maritypicum TaxID=33918 RepID=UPI001B333367|nr:hypothetical protein [Microbacterium liquefaciens]MBP5800749.1 hypothetical protein [Microbacterium liquefaciens]
MDQAEFVVDFPTLGDLGDAWITRHCRVPDGFTRGRAFEMADWQFWCHANRYRIRPDAYFVPPELVGPDMPPVLNQAFFYQQTLVVAPQKTGKGPFSASQVAFEAAGPSVFAGWAEGGEVYSCAENGCPCGWEDAPDAFVYEKGDAMGMRHPSPLIQITANSAEQADNIYKPLRAMINLGPLRHLLAVREGFIRILGLSDQDDLDRIDVVTSSARSRLGNPISDAEQDEAGLYTKSNKMVDVADTQARGAAGMGGRTHLTTNAWDPSENSYAQMIFEAQEPDVFIFYRDPDKALRGDDGKPLDYKKVADRRRIHEYAYEGSWWVNLDSIEALARKLMKRDPEQAERFFGNRLVAGHGKWLEDGQWEAKAVPGRTLPKRAPVTGGFDGSNNDDYTGIRLELLPDLFQFTPTYGPDERKTLWNPADWGGQIPRGEVMVAWREIAKRFDLVRVYLDPFLYDSEIDSLAAEFGDDVFVKWATNRPVPMHAALERLKVDLDNDDSDFTHDGDEEVRTHMRNARIRPTTVDKTSGVKRYVIGKPFGEDHRKIDYAMSSVLAHEAAMDALASGWKPKKSSKVRVWR